MEGFAYFPTIVYRDERHDLTEIAINACNKHFDSISTENKNLPLVQTGNIVHDPELRILSDYILLSSVDLLRSQGYLTDKYDFYISGMWAQEIKPSASTNAHVHKNSQMCGWFFLNSPENGSYPIYYDTRMNKEIIELDFEYDKDINNATNSIHFNSMKSGTVMFGNSWMKHQLSVNNSTESTKCIHFIVSHRDKLCNMC